MAKKHMSPTDDLTLLIEKIRAYVKRKGIRESDVEEAIANTRKKKCRS